MKLTSNFIGQNSPQNSAPTVENSACGTNRSEKKIIVGFFLRRRRAKPDMGGC